MLGNCFQNAMRLFLEHDDWVLVHGLVRHPKQGFLHVHAWCEHGNVCYDFNPSNNKLIAIPAIAYYALGGIDKCTRYETLNEVLANMQRHGHYGPWEDYLWELDEAVR